MSAFWFEQLADVVGTHLVSTDVADFGPAAQPHRDALAGRTMLVREVDIVPFECVVRGYLAGSGWIEYQRDRSVCGVRLPDGLVQARPPARADLHPRHQGRERRARRELTFEVMAGGVGQELASACGSWRWSCTGGRSRGRRARDPLADTKFEFGLDEDGRVVLADEVLTPDSSRYWPADQ